MAHQDAYACGTVDVQLLAFNDFHGNLEPPAGSSGRIVTALATPPALPPPWTRAAAEFMATHLNRLRAQNPKHLRGRRRRHHRASPLLSALFHDEPTIESMNLMG